MVGAGWVDVDPVHRLLVHDWAQHADHATKMGLGRNRLSFCAHTVLTPCAQVSLGVNSVSTPEALPVPVPVPEAKAKAKAKAKAAPPKAPPFVIPDWFDKDTWTAFEEMRRKIKKPMTDRARRNIVAKLIRFETMGFQVEAVLGVCRP